MRTRDLHLVAEARSSATYIEKLMCIISPLKICLKTIFSGKGRSPTKAASSLKMLLGVSRSSVCCLDAQSTPIESQSEDIKS